VFVSSVIAVATSNASSTPLENTRPRRSRKHTLATSKTPFKGLKISAGVPCSNPAVGGTRVPPHLNLWGQLLARRFRYSNDLDLVRFYSL
jgi:hypothetical protein